MSRMVGFTGTGELGSNLAPRSRRTVKENPRKVDLRGVLSTHSMWENQGCFVLANAAGFAGIVGYIESVVCEGELGTIPSKEKRKALGSRPRGRFGETGVDEIGRPLVDHHPATRDH